MPIASPAGLNSALTSGDGAKPFLACSIPDLKLDLLAINLDRPDFEVNAVSRNAVAMCKDAAMLDPSCAQLCSAHALPLTRWL